MKLKTVLRMIFCSAMLLLLGCKPTGYQILLSADFAKTDDISYIEAILKTEGFNILTYEPNGNGKGTEWKEREIYAGRYPGEVYTALMKRISSDDYFWVEVYIHYVKGADDKIAHILIVIENKYVGDTIPQIKAQIDRTEELVYSVFSGRLGKDKVRVEKNRVVSPISRIGW
jgi:hypothetical protein